MNRIVTAANMFKWGAILIAAIIVHRRASVLVLPVGGRKTERERARPGYISETQGRGRGWRWLALVKWAISSL